MEQRITTWWTTTALALTLAGCPGGDDVGSEDGGMDASSGSATGGSGGTTAGSEAGTAVATGEMTDSEGESGMGDTTTGGEGESEGSSDETTGASGEPGPDLRELGPFIVQTDSGNESLPGCQMGYDSYTPMGAEDAPVVVLAHGFQGNRGTMAGWAEHWASWGVRVIAPDLCHASIIDTDHPQNGADLRALVDQLGVGPVVYAGYSAGGLAAVLAGAQDGTALAVLGLDMVDADGLGLAAAPGITAPAFDVVGEPSQCNTTNNGIAVFGAAGGQSLRITDADHCDFQSPADFLCGLTCNGSNPTFDDAEIQTAVRALSTAVVVWQTGVEPTGVQWWTPGAPYYDELTGVGIVQVP